VKTVKKLEKALPEDENFQLKDMNPL